MYLRRNKVGSGEGQRVYRSIAHNVWARRTEEGSQQSRPVILARLGAEEDVDLQIACELVEVVEKCFAWRKAPGDGRREEVERAAYELRQIEAFFRVLVNPRLGLAGHIPDPHRRLEVLDALVRDRLADPAGSSNDERMLESVREHFDG